MTDVTALVTQVVTQIAASLPEVAAYDGTEQILVLQGLDLKRDPAGSASAMAAAASASAAAASAAEAHDYAVAAQSALAAQNFGAAMTAWLTSLPTTIPATPGLPWLNNGVLSISQ